MKLIKNDIAVFHCEESIAPLIMKLCDIARKNPSILTPFRGVKEDVRELLDSFGFILYPTVRKTTVIYDRTTDCFFKILHLTIKEMTIHFLTDRSKSIYNLSQHLFSNGIKVPEVVSYGTFKKGRKPFWVMKRVPGKSLFDILVREGKPLERELYFKVIDRIAEIHKLGYCFGDAHLSHIFIDKEAISGFIDIDSIKKNISFRLRNLAKDIAGLNYPDIPLTKDEKMELLNYYMDIMGIKDKNKFINMVKYFSEKRWKK